jgi:hypothetical protein
MMNAGPLGGRIETVTQPRVLYISPLDLRTQNGMTQHQHQLLLMLVSLYGDSVDLLSLGTSPAVARQWVKGGTSEYHPLVWRRSGALQQAALDRPVLFSFADPFAA